MQRPSRKFFYNSLSTYSISFTKTKKSDGRIVYFQNAKEAYEVEANFFVAIFDIRDNSTTVKNLGKQEATEQYFKEYQFGFLGTCHVYGKLFD